MRVKGKRIINTEEAAEFSNTVRGQYIISHALVLGIEKLKKYEDKDSVYAGILIIREILRAKWRRYDDSNNKSFDKKQY